MRILRVDPEKRPVVCDIDGSLSSMQEIVGGTIEAIYPWGEPVALVCHDEGKLLGLPLNRALTDEEGTVWDIVAGTFFLCGAPSDCDHFISLEEEHLQTFQAQFAKPELFLQLDGQLMVLRG